MSNARELAELGLEVDVDANGNVVVANDIISIGNADEKSIGFNFYGQSKYNFHMDGNTDGDKMFIRKGTTNVAAFDTAGKLGLGVDGPATTLHVDQTADNSGITLGYSGRGPSRAIWEMSGVTNSGTVFRHHNGTDNYVTSYHSRDVHFWNTGNTERMRLESGGRLCMGRTSPLAFTASDEEGVVLEQNAIVSSRYNESPCWLKRFGTDGSIIQFFKSTSVVGSVSVSSSGTTYNTTSDRRLKTDIQPITNGTEKLMAMNPVTHKWKADPHTGETVVGFIAQEMQEIVPEAVSGDPDGEEMMSMDYGRITPVLVAALQDAHKKIEALEERLAELEAK